MGEPEGDDDGIAADESIVEPAEVAESTPDTRAALATWTKFSDTILDRLFALNTLRAAQQAKK